MSVLIKGMQMPRKCFNCLMCDRDTFRRWFCVATLDEIPIEQLNIVQENCPLVEVPTPHGDLIDRWELTETAMIDPDEGKYVAVYRADEVDEAPVVIEAEGRE